MSQFEQLGSLLTQLAEQSAQLDRQRGEHHRPLFDERLFHCQSRLLVHCVQESRGIFESLMREKNADRLTAPRAEYLTEQLVAQISAIQRELSTHGLRNKEPKHRSFYRKPINVLYQDLAQHQEWERRLKEMVRDQEQAVANASFGQQQQQQKALITVEQRLARCQESKLKLENQITYREKNQ